MPKHRRLNKSKNKQNINETNRRKKTKQQQNTNEYRKSNPVKRNEKNKNHYLNGINFRED